VTESAYNAKNAIIRWELLDRNLYKLRKAEPRFMFFFWVLVLHRDL